MRALAFGLVLALCGVFAPPPAYAQVMYNVVVSSCAGITYPAAGKTVPVYIDTSGNKCGTGTTGLPTGAATSAKQDTGNTSVASIDTKTGEVQASPTANTVLDRLKALKTSVDALLTQLQAATPAGTNTIGGVFLQPTTSGGSSTYSGNITTAGSGAGTGGVAVDASPGQLYGYAIYNGNSSVCYIQIFDQTQALTNLGTTVPKIAFGIPANGGANLTMPNGIPFATAITAGVTTTRAGSTACSSGLDVNLWFK